MPTVTSTSAKRIKANRLNAQKSTGPRTEAGKERSRRNALKHGLTAEELLLPGEDPANFEALHQGLLADLKPRGVLEAELVSEVVKLLWRIRRVPVFEAALIRWQQETLENDAPLDALVAGTWHLNEPLEAVPEVPTGRIIAALLRTDLVGKLNRHEMNLQRKLGSALKQLQDIQARRAQGAASGDVEDIEHEDIVPASQSCDDVASGRAGP